MLVYYGQPTPYDKLVDRVDATLLTGSGASQLSAVTVGFWVPWRRNM